MGKILKVDFMGEKKTLDKGQEYLKLALNYFISEDYFNGVLYFEIAASYGNIESQYMLSRINIEGIGKRVNTEEGIKWLKKASDNGDFVSKGTLALMYLTGEIVDKDIKKGEILLSEVENCKEPITYICLGNKFLEKEYYNIAFYYYKRAHSFGDIYGTYSLARCYHEGYGIEKDLSKATKYYYEAVYNGYNENLKYIESCIESCQGILKNFNEKVKSGQGEDFSTIKELRNNLVLLYNCCNLKGLL